MSNNCQTAPSTAIAAELRPDVSVVIVNYRTPELVAECIKSIRRTAGPLVVQIVIVDNDSGDGSAAFLRDHFPGETVVEASENGGFARGNALGISHTTGDRVLLLNPDTELFQGSLLNAAAALDAEPDIGMVGACAELPDKRLQSTMIRFPSLKALLFAILLPSKLLRRFVWAGDTRYASRDPAHPQEVDAVAGGFMLVRRAVLEQVGGLDPKFFMYGEELEWCHRIRQAGWRIVYRPEVRMLHHGGASSSHRTVWKAREMMRGQLLYFRIVHGTRYARAAALLMLLRDVVRLPFAIVLFISGSGKEALKAILARIKLGLVSFISPPRGQTPEPFESDHA